jgi:hypothetical protein
MTQEEKELVIKDLSSRLPYNCMVSIAEGGIDGIKWADLTLNAYLFYQIMEEDAWEYVKPYLRPMSSMTENEKSVYLTLRAHAGAFTCVEWLDKNHFDHRTDMDGEHLIQLHLALEAKDGMYNN